MQKNKQTEINKDGKRVNVSSYNKLECIIILP